MKQTVKIKLLTFLMILGSLAIVNAQLLDLKILTFNMQQPFGTNWDGRKASAAQIINTYQGDIIGTQELVNYQRDYIMNNCSGYTVYGQGRDCGDNGEGSWIMFKTAKFTLDGANSGNFWFSDNPNVCARGYDPNYNRICTYVRLIDKATGKAFYVFNAHFPTPDQPSARTKSMTLLCARAAARAFTNDPVIFTGDFNSLETETQINYIKSGATNPLKMRDTYRELYPTGNVTTGFGVKFDYIFTENKSNVSALATQVITSPVASDHFPLSATIRLNFGSNPNPPIVFYTIPGKVEAENFSAMSGVQIENTTDAGAGANLGFLDAGDFIEYSINSTSNDAYDISFRLASLTGGGVFKLQLDGVDMPGLINVSASGGWQTWVNVLKSNVLISSGNHKIRLVVVTGGFNINWLNFSKYTVVPTNGELKVLTQNLWRRNDSWVNRRNNIITMINAQAPDFIAITEGDEGKAPEVDNLLINYSLEKGPWNEESTSIIYNHNTLSIVQTGVFGYSSTPDQNITSNWGDGAVNGWLRKCNWVLFEQIATGKRFYVYNNHLDALNSPLGPAYWRLEEAKLMATRIAARSNPQYPFIVIGDLNEHENGNAIAYLKSGSANTVQMKDTYREILPNGDGYTFGTIKLDYIFIQKNSSITTLDANIIYQSNYGQLSDHNAIWAKLSLNGTTPPLTPIITLSQSSLIEEGAENGKTITITAANGQFVNTLNTSNWTITNLPSGVTKGAITRLSDTQVTITLSGNATIGTYTKNITDVTVTIGAAEFVGGSVVVSKNSGITLTQAVPSIPGKVEAENYTTMSGVQVENTTDDGAGKNVGWLDAGDFLEYKINATATSAYDIAFRLASLVGGGVMKIQIDGVDVPGLINSSVTGGWQTWVSLIKANVMITSGTHTIRLVVVTGGFNINYINFSTAVIPQSPFNNVMVSIPGKVEAENYDLGGQGIAFNDNTTGNQGAVYRSDGVDLEATSDIDGGYNVGWTADGEWLEYTVNVVASGNYDIAFRTASAGGGKIRMEIDGLDVTGNVDLPNTNGWQTWATTTKLNVALAAGQHVMRLAIVVGGFNLNNVKVTTAIPPGPGFLHASGKNIVNNNGNYVIKAANIGNYMVQEGYMLNLGGGYQHVIKQKIADVVGVTNRDKFYEDYRANYLVKADIDSLAKWGFNSIRLPMHYNLFTPLGQPDVFLESGFAEVDKIISWCKANNMYVILDLHAAPGGQSSGDISDYVAGQPSLWESAENRAQTVKLWRKFAERYANEQYVGGYDLINETNWTIPGNGLLATLMKEITASIRQVDNNHLLFIEGNSYANDYTGLTPKWDNNMAYSFHKYWNDVNDGSINWVLALRDAENAPIWLGEFGENSNHWIAETVSLMNKHNIGWAIWPYKKMSSISGIGSFKEPNNWPLLKDYINGGAMPSAAIGQAILDELVENVKLANTKINKGYLFALFPSANNATIPFAYAELPGKLVAANYDEGKNGYAYSDIAYQTSHFGSGGGSYSPWNNGYYLRNDGVDVQFSEAENSSTVGWVENNEWLLYTVNVKTTGYYAVKIRVAGNGGKASLSSNGASLLNMVTLSATNGWEDFQTIDFGNVKLNAGQQSIKLTINTGGFNINYLDFSLLPNQSPTVVITSPTINSTFNAPANVTINVSATDIDGTISTVNFYNGTSLIGSDNTAPFTFIWNNVAEGLYSITAKAIDNNGAEAISAAVSINVEAVLSTLIQAEAYSSMLGVQTEPTLDISGVLNVGYIDAGDWMAYNTITFPTSGNYTIEYRVASYSGGMLSSDLNAGAIQLGSITIPATGGWQNWITVSQTVTVTAGTYNFGIFAKSGGWNINWFQITKQGSSLTRLGQSVLEESAVVEANFEFYPNPAHSTLHFNAPQELTGAKVQIFDVNGREVLSTTVEEMSIEISNLTGGLYTFLLNDDGVKIARRFVKQ